MRRSCECSQKLIYTKHAVDRMVEREIEPEDVLSALKTGVVIESKPNAKPNACCLVLGVTSTGRQVHVVVAIKKTRVIILTTYHPDVKVWGQDFKTKVVKTSGM